MTADEENRSELQVKKYKISKLQNYSSVLSELFLFFYFRYGIYILLLESNHDINLIRALFALTSGFKI